MDPSSLIFVALVVAWAVYFVPKALEYHEESLRKRTATTVSSSMRVVARRERTGRRSSRLVTPSTVVTSERVTESVATERTVAPKAPQVSYVEVPVELTPAQRRARRSAAARATKRRRNVLGVIVLGLAVVTVLAAVRTITWPWVAVPGGVLVAWLVACRLMVRKERALPTRRVPVAPATAADDTASVPVVEEPEVEGGSTTGSRVMVLDEEGQPTGVFVAVDDQTADGRWDPVDVPLPTYVSKPAAARSVRTIDLDGTGVWSSGRNDADSALAREADEAARDAKAAQQAAEQRRAAGS